ncbi:MAG: dihydroorotase, partial [Mariprofundales bacterium]|nr:dihydroorotase [Mariprofundales bacterium]
GTLSCGAAADICIFDMEQEWVLERSLLHSKSHNTPWHGVTMRGRVVQTLLSGRRVYPSVDG